MVLILEYHNELGASGCVFAAACTLYEAGSFT